MNQKYILYLGRIYKTSFSNKNMLNIHVAQQIKLNFQFLPFERSQSSIRIGHGVHQKVFCELVDT